MDGQDVVLQVGLSTALLNDKHDMKPLNLSLVIDKSGSMGDSDKMSRVKDALMALVAQLRETDVLSIVVFDDNARVLVAATRLTRKDLVRRAISEIVPGGSTNISDGLRLGYEEAKKSFRKDATNRVVLLTDGIANRGETEPDAIARGSLKYNDEGIDLSTIGVGRDLNQDLLRTLAKSGRGLFHFVADAQDIGKVFASEVQSLLSPTAVDPNLRIEFGPGLKLEQVYGYDPEVSDNHVGIRLDNMNSGMTEVVLMRFRASAETGSKIAVRVKLTYYDLGRKKTVTKVEEATLTVTGSRGSDTFEDSSVAKNATIAQLAQSIKDMAESVEAGHNQEAERLISAAVSSAQERYPSMEDPDVLRTFSMARKYQDALRRENGTQGIVGERPLNLIPNGDFSLGNTGFASGLPYIAPSPNCLWGCYYTVAPRFNEMPLHTLIPNGEYAAPMRPNGNEQVFYANAGGTEEIALWTSEVKCKPNTTYRISFQSISLTPGREWIPMYEIRVNGERSQSQPGGYGSYSEVSFVWRSKEARTASVSIVRTPMANLGRLVAIANIEMVEGG